MITLKRRSFFGRLIRWPKLFLQHYEIARRYENRRMSFYSFRFANLVLKNI